MFDGLLGGCNGKPNWCSKNTIIGNNLCPEKKPPTPTPTVIPDCKHLEHCDDAAVYIPSGTKTVFELAEDSSLNDFKIPSYETGRLR